MKIIVTAGGTGGHIYPALSMIKKFQKEEETLEVLYIGTHNRMEKDIVPELGIKYEALEIYGFSKSIKRNIKNVVLLKKAYNRCIEIMKEFKPDVVLGFGGYVTFPVIKAANKLGITTFIHEQNSIPGKSNKMLSRYADIIGVTFKSSMSYFKNKHVIYSGHPRSDEAILADSVDKKELGLNNHKMLVVIVLGSLGSGSLNSKLMDYINLVGDENNYEVLYITGKNHQNNKVDKLPKNVKIIPYYDNLIGLFKDTDVVISRAGSGVLNELIALNIPSVIIPSPNVANNHQYYNAKDLEDNKACIMMGEDNLDVQVLKDNVEKLLFDDNLREKMVKKLEKLTVKNSMDKIYKEIKKVLNEKNR